MKQTTNYQLPQWEETDRIMMKDFNGMTDKLDKVLAGKGNCRIATGTYTGTGEYGQEHPNSITFDFLPKLVLIYRTDYAYSNWHIIAPGASYAICAGNLSSQYLLNVSWEGTTVSYYAEDSANYQNNHENAEYTYIALG